MRKIYTTYLANLKKVKLDNTAMIIVMRMPPAAFYNNDNYIHCPELSPYTNDLISYKKTGDFDTLIDEYKKMLETDETVKRYINYAIQVLEDKNGNDICFICCEKDRNVCHRKILAEYIGSITNCEVIEL